MQQALALANQAATFNDVPVGALVVNDKGEIIGVGENLREKNNDPTAHAEIVAIKNAAQKIDNSIVQTRMKRLVFGTFDEKAGAVGSVWDVVRDTRALTKIEVISGVLEKECAQVLTKFFKGKR